MTRIHLNELARQEYTNCVLSAGKVEGMEPDTIYLQFERAGEEDTTLYLRQDEAITIIWLLSGCLWSNEIGYLARIDELEAQLRAREQDFRTQNTLIEKIAELQQRIAELEAQLANYHTHLTQGTLVWKVPPPDYYLQQFDGEGVA